MAGNSNTQDKTYTQKEDHRENDVDMPAPGWGIRHLQTAVMAMASLMAYSLRTNLSVAIVAMVRYNETNRANATYQTEYPPTYEWDEKEQGYVLSSFFWGYLMTQIPAGILTGRFGGHRFLCFSIFGSSFLTLLLPPCAYTGGWVLVCINRMLQGICQGFVYPSMFTLLGVWAPPVERGRLSSCSVGAQMLGTVLATPLSGFLSFAYGWPSVFYTFGTLGLVTSLVTVFLGADSPAKHKMISEAEKHFIHSSLGGANVKLSVPWREILTSLPFWSALITTSFLTMVFLAFLTEVPTYLATVLKFEIKDNGLISALPYLVSWICSYIFSWLSDFLTESGRLKLTTSRKIFNSIAHFGSAVLMILMAHAGSRIMSVFLLTSFMGVFAASFPGVQANFLDLAPNFSGAVFSIANFVSSFLGVCGPIIIGFIVSEAGSAAQWCIVFYLWAVILTLSNVVFVVFGTAKTQWWNWPDRYNNKNEFNEFMKKKTIPQKNDITSSNHFDEDHQFIRSYCTNIKAV